MRGLIIGSPYIDWILAGKKTWEIRGSPVNFREKIGLIRSGSGLVVATCDLVDFVGPLSLRELKRNARKVARSCPEIRVKPYKTTYALVLSNVRKLERPRPYTYRPGAIIWVKLPDV